MFHATRDELIKLERLGEEVPSDLLKRKTFIF